MTSILFAILLVGRRLTLCPAVLSHLFACSLRAEEVAQSEVVDLVSPSDDEVLGACFGELSAGHAQVEHACGLVFHLERHVVVQRGVEADQGREALVDADGADVVEAVGLIDA